MTSNTTISPLDNCRSVFQTSLAEGNLKLPVLPQATSEILTVINRPDATIDELSKLIEKDQVLASHVIKTANSAAYSGGADIENLNEAVTRLGMKQLGDIAIAISLQSDCLKVPDYARHHKESMEHALITALYCQEIAKLIMFDANELFLCGLLHSIGKPAVLNLIDQTLGTNNERLTYKETKTLLDEFHLPFGLAITQQWKMPEIIQVVASQYSNYQESDSIYQEPLRITYLASLLAEWLTHPASLDADLICNDPVLELLGITDEQLDLLFEKNNDVLNISTFMYS